jgi:hypothetical protein
MLGLPTSVTIAEESGFDVRNNYVGAFVQDTWRVGRNLTLNLGLRFEYENGIKEVKDRSLLWFDPEAAVECEARMLTSDRRAALAELLAPRAAANCGALPVTLLQGVGKGDKLEDVVRMVTALGAQAVTFVLAERSVARPSEERALRLRDAALDAARQSGRGDIPRIQGPLSFESAIEPWQREPSFALRFPTKPLTPSRSGAVIAACRWAASFAVMVQSRCAAASCEFQTRRSHQATSADEAIQMTEWRRDWQQYGARTA